MKTTDHGPEASTLSRVRGPFAVLGAGLSGRAVETLLLRLGLACTVFDEAGGGGAEREFSPAGFGTFVVSPGFAVDHPWRRRAEESGRPCFGEVGLAASLWRGPILGVTGTNGKTTVTRLLREALEESGRPAVAAGNIGRPLASLVREPWNDGSFTAVCELSSFQAELTRGLRLDGLLWTNFAEDHLDRHAGMRAYFEAKSNLFGCLAPGAPCLIGPTVAAWAERLGVQLPEAARVVEKESPSAAYPGGFVRGHQAENFDLAKAWWEAAGLAEDGLIRAARRFRPSPHRLHRFVSGGGLECWDDSKATNFHAALAAMDALEGRIVWVGGGRAKGGDPGAFAHAASRRVAAAFLYGEVAPGLAVRFERTGCPVRAFDRFGEAVEAAFGAAAADRPAHLLLSPGFASFDQFSSYAERGKTFVSMVLGLMSASGWNYSADTFDLYPADA